jgi:hypothetical protein
MVDKSLRHRDGSKASIANIVHVALLKIMENEGGLVS